jgi:hypothetical protein
MSAQKRWGAEAQLAANGRYVVGPPRRITPAQLLAAVALPSTLIGFDFPLGVPAAYARMAGVQRFTELLPMLGTGAWSSFFDVARTASEISVHRPFYPNAPGGRSRAQLVVALGLTSDDDLYRECDVAEGRRACPIFWTLGGNQVGKAALTGWRELVLPAVATGLASLWPFDGSLEELLAREHAVLAETYPADTYAYVGATPPAPDKKQREAAPAGKRIQAWRSACAESVILRATRGHVTLKPELVSQLRDGFGRDREGEDRFDAVMGLLGMLAVLRGERAPGAASSPGVQAQEGWILGRATTTPPLA